MLTLYVRPGCHLCAQAEQLLVRENIACQRVNIDRDPVLKQEYGLLVPVLYDPQTDAELVCPFDVPDVHRFLAEIDRKTASIQT